MPPKSEAPRRDLRVVRNWASYGVSNDSAPGEALTICQSMNLVANSNCVWLQQHLDFPWSKRQTQRQRSSWSSHKVSINRPRRRAGGKNLPRDPASRNSPWNRPRPLSHLHRTGRPRRHHRRRDALRYPSLIVRYHSFASRRLSLILCAHSTSRPFRRSASDVRGA